VALRTPDKITKNPRFSQPNKGHYRGVTNPILQDAARIEIVPSEKRETPALKEVLSLARREISLAPSRLARMQSLRTSELGIRMALGAQRDQLLQLMLMDGLRPALFGLGLGLVVSFAATRIFQSMLFGTKPLDPVVLSGVIATLLAVAVLACLAPAWRAARLDPMKALRTE
jgi:hypothetical protein